MTNCAGAPINNLDLIGGQPLASIQKVCLHNDVYNPAEDSFLLVDFLLQKRHCWASSGKKICLEIGCGSGYVICSLALMLKDVGTDSCILATDINATALESTRETLKAHEVQGAELFCTNLVDGLEQRLQGTVDILVFNPPYVPTPDEEINKGGIAASWAGGYKGRVVIDKFIPKVSQLLSPTGELFLVAVAENEPQDIIKLLEGQGLKGSVGMERVADEERLCVLHFTRH